MLTISLSWAVAVDLTPAASRPYVGSSQNNSEISLALGYNGIQRLLGQLDLGGNSASSSTSGTTSRQFQPPTSSNGTAIGNFQCKFKRGGFDYSGDESACYGVGRLLRQ